MKKQKIRIGIADNQELFRKSLSMLLGINVEFEVITDVADGRELLEFLKHTALDVVLLDSDISKMNAKALIPIMRTRFINTRVIVLSSRSHPELASDYMLLGASGFLSKNTDVKKLFKAIYQVKEDGIFFDGDTSKALLEAVLKEKQRPVLLELHFNEREMEILRSICDGFTNKQIALSLNLSASTIDFYRTRIYGKTKCNNVTSLIKYALKNGLIVIS